MKSKLFVFGISAFLLFGLASCGGDSDNAGRVCDETAAALFQYCDNTDATDQQTIIDAAAAAGETLSVLQVQMATEAAVVDQCEADLEGTEITDAEYELGRAQLDAAISTGTCVAVAGVVFGMLP